jgi:hypothetical protein
MSQHVVDHRRKYLRVGRIETARNSGLSHLLWICGTHMLQGRNRQECN